MDDNSNSLSAYLEEIGQTQQLTNQQEAELAERIQKGDNRAIDQLAQANLKFVVSIAKQYKGRGLAMEDLVSEGNIGLLKAAKNYKAHFDKRFVSYAAPYIRQAILHAIDQQAGLYRVPRDVMDAAREKRISRPLSMDAPIGGSQDLSLGRVLADQDSPVPDDVLNQHLLSETLQPLLRQLKPREQHVVQRFYGVGATPLTMAEIGQEMGLKRERVRQIRDQAVRHLIKLTDSEALKTFLRK